MEKITTWDSSYYPIISLY